MENKDKEIVEKIEGFVRKTQVSLVKQMGDEIGYGHLMALAAAHWRVKLKEINAPESEAFVPVLIDFLKKEDKKMAEKEVNYYDEYIKNNTL